MQVVFSKTDKMKDLKRQKQWSFTYFLTDIFARTELKEERFCKIKPTDLRF